MKRLAVLSLVAVVGMGVVAGCSRAPSSSTGGVSAAPAGGMMHGDGKMKDAPMAGGMMADDKMASPKMADPKMASGPMMKDEKMLKTDEAK